jgi:uncharacterized protein YpuA (DUF1002 family)|tara:strand:- start:16027 stop:16296 length:270 start_codon:yes stop_codon:yes gene_type:complete
MSYTQERVELALDLYEYHDLKMVQDYRMDCQYIQEYVEDNYEIDITEDDAAEIWAWFSAQMHSEWLITNDSQIKEAFEMFLTERLAYGE